ncbi:hypothetical protein COO60DRAFT_1703219 [Scenedesmus sp. NREL 46B-D3]|nr:hypothetical protein COO60DRAFT_1703219 [Scenedesmus sp. NREL 46B-D3]
MAQKPASVKVLHRAIDGQSSDEDSPNGTGSPQQQIERFKAENNSLKQRLEQAKATSASERKRLADDLRIERAGRQRAEELLVKQAKELESVTAAKGRLEDAFSRSMAELRYTRLEYQQSEQTIQQLLRELMLLREIVNRVSALSSTAASNGGSQADTDASSGGGAPAAAAGLSNKRISRSKLLGELQQLRQAKAAAESRQVSLLQRLGTLEAEKERAEESQEMISRETAKLLDDKHKLLNDLGSKDDAVRGLEAGLDHLQHQLELALTDRQLLLEELTKVADKGEMEMLQQALQEEGGVSGRCSSAGLSGCAQGEVQQQQVDEHQLLMQELEALQMQMQAEGLGDSSCSNQPVMA